MAIQNARYTNESKEYVAYSSPEGDHCDPVAVFSRKHPGVEIAPWADPRTPQQIYDEEVLAPTDKAMLAPRLIEELFDWAVNGVALPDSSKAKYSPVVADRKAKRSKRP